jgi:hypothetical protein
MPYRAVSRRHLRVYLNDHIEIEDLGSSNGTSLIQADRDLEEGATSPASKVRLEPGVRTRIAATPVKPVIAAAPNPRRDSMAKSPSILRIAADGDFAVLMRPTARSPIC